MRLAVVIDVDGDIMYVPEGKVFPKACPLGNIRHC